jgi:glutamyl-tRNA(Gln) amidotransferase subunit D
MQIVHVLTTGGTIATRIDSSLGAATIVGVDKLVSSVAIPEVKVEFQEVFRKGSAEIVPKDWMTLADRIVTSLEQRVEGIVVLHGTDTMQYTASAVSFMLQGLSVPIVFTGSMIPGHEPNSDSIGNMRAAVRVAASADLAETCIVFSSDEVGINKSIIRATRAKKIHSSAINAFASINSPQIGLVKGDGIELSSHRIVRETRELKARITLNPNVGLVKYSPGLTGHQLKTLLNGLDGAVFEGTGIGHIRSDLQIEIMKFEKPVVITTQCTFGGEKLGIYDIDKEVLELPNIVKSGDMLPEVALTKLMWVLSHTDKLEEARALMERPLVGEKN